ncbi:MAG: hypothetical protein M1569_02725 [Candidatus Marsarchaeota archaeon]|nr:hypothetical protein [Candidatus Marsarchaeota archaeon]MCL5413293.1 hypothetical protein [Candidatus Marsarchaeota archaeon]
MVHKKLRTHVSELKVRFGAKGAKAKRHVPAHLYHKKSVKTAAGLSYKSRKQAVRKRAARMSAADLKKEDSERAEKELAIEEVRKVGELVENRGFLQHIDKGVGAGSIDILRTLVKGPYTDEDISARLGLKVNDVRRMLNVMNEYGIVRYDVNKDNKGWLIFRWRIDRERLVDYISNIESHLAETGPVLPGDCNDFFMCKKCYSEQKLVVPFDSAFESGFTCNSCGKPYVILNREQTVALFKETVTETG